MGKRKIDRAVVRGLRDQGYQVVEIAEKLGVTKGAVSKALKEMRLEIARSATAVAPRYAARKDAASEHLMYLMDRARQELQWIEDSVVPEADEEYRAWQDQKLKFAAEMRKLVSAMGDVAYKLYQANEVAEVLKIIEEEIGHESPGCQRRIRDRIQARRAARFPIEQHYEAPGR